MAGVSESRFHQDSESTGLAAPPSPRCLSASKVNRFLYHVEKSGVKRYGPAFSRYFAGSTLSMTIAFDPPRS